MVNTQSVLENEMPEILCDFEIQTDPQIQGRKPDLVLTNEKKRTCQLVDFAVPADQWVKIQNS